MLNTLPTWLRRLIDVVALVTLGLATAAAAVVVVRGPREIDGVANLEDPRLAPPARTAGVPTRDALGDPLPKGAIARLGTARFRTGGTPEALAFSTDNSLLACASDGAVFVWNMPDGRLRHRLAVEGDRPLQLAFVREGNLVAAGQSDGRVRLWDARRGELVRTLDGHKPSWMDGLHEELGLRFGRRTQPLPCYISALAFSPDGNLLVTGSPIGNMRVWHVSSGRMLRELWGHTDPILAIDFSPDGQRLLSAGQDGRLRLWNLQSGRFAHRFANETDPFEYATFSPDGRTIAAIVGGKSPRVVAWDASSFKVRCDWPGPPLPQPTHLAWVEDGLATIFENLTVVVRDVATGNEVRKLSAAIEGQPWSNPGAVASSSDGQYLALGAYHFRTRVLDLQSGKALDQGLGNVFRMVANHEGTQLAIEGASWGVFDVAQQTALWLRNDERCWPLSLAENLSTWQKQTTVLLRFDAKTGRPLSRESIPAVEHFTPCQVSSDGRMAFFIEHLDPERADFATNLRLWDRSLAPSETTLFAIGNRVTLCEISPDNRFGVVDSNHNEMVVLDLAARRELGRIPRTAFNYLPVLRCVAVGSRTLAIALDGQPVEIWQYQPLHKMAELSVETYRITAIALSPDERLLAMVGKIAAEPPRLVLWDLESLKPLRRLESQLGDIQQLAFSGDGRRLFSAATDGTIVVWDVADLAHEQPEPRER